MPSKRTANSHANSEDKCAKFIEAAVWMARSGDQWRRIKRGKSSQALGKSVGGFTSKAHISVDALGNPLRFILTGGEKPDITQAAELIEGLESEYETAYRGYDADAFRWRVIERRGNGGDTASEECEAAYGCDEYLHGSATWRSAS